MIANIISAVKGLVGGKRTRSTESLIALQPESHVLHCAGGGVGLTAGVTHELKTFYCEDGEWKPLPEYPNSLELNEAGYTRFVTKIFHRAPGGDWKPMKPWPTYARTIQ